MNKRQIKKIRNKLYQRMRCNRRRAEFIIIIDGKIHVYSTSDSVKPLSLRKWVR